MLDPCPWLRIMNKEFCKSLFLWSTTNMPAPAMSPFMWEIGDRKTINMISDMRPPIPGTSAFPVTALFQNNTEIGWAAACWKYQNCRWILSRSESWHNWCLFLTGCDDSCISSNFLNSLLPKKSIKSPHSTFMNSNYQHLPSLSKEVKHTRTKTFKRTPCIIRCRLRTPKTQFQNSKLSYHYK